MLDQGFNPFLEKNEKIQDLTKKLQEMYQYEDNYNKRMNNCQIKLGWTADFHKINISFKRSMLDMQFFTNILKIILYDQTICFSLHVEITFTPAEVIIW